MAKTSLVDAEVEAGLRLIELLDKQEFGIAAAVWLYTGDTDVWKLVLGYRGDKSKLGDKYQEAALILSKERESNGLHPILDLSRVRIVHISNPLFQGLKPLVRADGIVSVHISESYLNNIYIEEAVIHRMAA